MPVKNPSSAGSPPTMSRSCTLMRRLALALKVIVEIVPGGAPAFASIIALASRVWLFPVPAPPRIISGPSGDSAAFCWISSSGGIFQVSGSSGRGFGFSNSASIVSRSSCVVILQSRAVRRRAVLLHTRHRMSRVPFRRCRSGDRFAQLAPQFQHEPPRSI